MMVNEQVDVCEGSQMDGLDIDLIDYCGLPELSDTEHDKLWGKTNPLDLLESCQWAFFDWQDEDEIENVPLYTDRYFTVTTTDEEKLKQELRETIRKELK